AAEGTRRVGLGPRVREHRAVAQDHHEGADVVVVVVLGVVPALEGHAYAAGGSGCGTADEDARVLKPRTHLTANLGSDRLRFGRGIGEGVDRRLEEAAEVLVCFGRL